MEYAASTIRNYKSGWIGMKVASNKSDGEGRIEDNRLYKDCFKIKKIYRETDRYRQTDT